MAAPPVCAGCAAAVAVVAFGHHQLGEEAEVGQLLALAAAAISSNRPRMVGSRSTGVAESIAASSLSADDRFCLGSTSRSARHGQGQMGELRGRLGSGNSVPVKSG
jgi:hypothetical protein